MHCAAMKKDSASRAMEGEAGRIFNAAALRSLPPAAVTVPVPVFSPTACCVWGGATSKRWQWACQAVVGLVGRRPAWLRLAFADKTTTASSYFITTLPFQRLQSNLAVALLHSREKTPGAGDVGAPSGTP